MFDYIICAFFWPALLFFLAYPQGVLMPAVRRTPPGPEATSQARALHLGLVLAYFLPLVLVAVFARPHLPLHAVVAVLVRLAGFDPILNHYAGDESFHVGQTATTDKLLRKLSATHPERLSVALRLAAGALAVAAVVVAAGR